MKKILLHYLLILLAINFSLAQIPQYKQWDYSYGGLGSESIYALRKTHDNGYIIGGITNSDSSGNVSQHGRGNFDYWLVKIKPDGSYDWDKRFGSDSADYISDVIQTTDNGFLIVGYSKGTPGGDMTSQPHGGYDFWAVKTDSVGNKIWDKCYGGIQDDQVYSVCETNDGGYLMGGISYSSSSGNVTHISHGVSDYWIIKVDSQGNILWNQLYGGSDQEELRTVIPCFDGGFLLTGHSISDSTGNVSHHHHGHEDFWILKTDSLGTIEWDKLFGADYQEYLYSATQSLDSGFALFGMTASNAGGDVTEMSRGYSDYWLLKIDRTGNKLWDHRFGGNDDDIGLGYVSQNSDGGYLVSGSSYSDSSGDKSENNLGWRQGWMVKTDSLGIKMWDKTILTNGYDYVGLAIESEPGCYTFGIETFSDSAGYVSHDTQAWDCFLVKFCDQAVSAPEFLQAENQLLLFPNPGGSDISILCSEGISQIILMNSTGAVLKIISVPEKIPPLKIDIDVSSIPSGIYFIQVESVSGNFFEKFIKQ